jgi:hypothetical protein
MSDGALFSFIIRGLLQLVIYILSQLPKRMNARVNSKAFLEAFQWGSVDSPTQVHTWKLAPGWQENDEASVPNLPEESTEYSSGLADNSDIRWRVIQTCLSKREACKPFYNLTCTTLIGNTPPGK